MNMFCEKKTNKQYNRARKAITFVTRSKSTFVTLTSQGITKELDQLRGDCLVCSHHIKQRIRFFFLISGKV